MNDYKCADCGCFINEGEFKTFGVCDKCWDAHYKKQTSMTQSDAPNEGKLKVGDQIDLFIGGELWKEKYATIIYFQDDGTPVAEMNYPGHDGCRWAHAYRIDSIRKHKIL